LLALILAGGAVTVAAPQTGVKGSPAKVPAKTAVKTTPAPKAAAKGTNAAAKGASAAVAKGTTTPAAKKTAAAPAKKATSAAAKKAASRSRRKVVARRTTQQQPTPDRYREIQLALVEAGYLKAAPTGLWDVQSEEALRRFQQDQKLQASGKLDALSLIRLGLGPKRPGFGPSNLPALVDTSVKP
jgi:peptidoglycan hydrolase-like protein with peptidoglycan-binding domain